MTKVIKKGVTVGEIFHRTNHLDNTVHDLKTRKKIVEDNLEYGNFFNNYFENQYNPHLSSSGQLSSDNNICGMLERMANYLIASDESKKMNLDEKTTYVFTDEYMQKKIRREHTDVPDSEGAMFNLLDKENIQIVKRPPKRNFIKFSNVAINKEDLNEDSKMGQILREYQELMNTIDFRTQNRIGLKRFNSKHKYLVSNDMLDVKKSYKGIFPPSFNKTTSFYQRPYEYFDLTDFKTVRSLLSVQGDFYTSYNLWLTILDLRHILSIIDLTDEERLVSDALFLGWRPIDIERDFSIDSYRIRRTVMSNISKKVIKYGDKYDYNDDENKVNIDKLMKNRVENEKNSENKDI